MLVETLQKARFRLRSFTLLRSFLRWIGLSHLARKYYERQIVKAGMTSVVRLGHRLNFTVSSAREIKRIDSPHAEVEFVTRMQSALVSGGVFFDIGANIGMVCLPIAKSNRTLDIHAFEPEPATATALKANVELNGLASSIKVNQIALSNANGNIDFNVTGGAGHGTHSIFQQVNENHSAIIQVQTLQMETYCHENSVIPNVIKIDVEGAEGLVLEGMQDVLANENLRDVFVEWHRPVLDSLGESLVALETKYLLACFERIWVDDRGQECQIHYKRRP